MLGEIMPHRAWHLYHEASSLTVADAALEARHWLAYQRKCYRRFKHFSLPTPIQTDPVTLQAALEARRTSHDFQRRVDARILAMLCRNCLEERHLANATEGTALRPYPSAGALYPIEVYFWLPYDLHPGIAKGKYHYCFLQQRLELLSPQVDERSIDEVFGQEFTLVGALTIILSAVVERSYRKYRERAYRFALLEAGHIAQSLCLTAAAVNISAAPLGGFHDEQLAKAFYLRTNLEVPIYAVALG